jgi:prolyl-tRNA editing enzyme YbaK/EbsC (Cys-tRNA(Pro) deacylase)
MSQMLSPSAQKVQEALLSKGFEFKVIEFTESTRTAHEAAERAGCKLGQIVKSMIFKGLTTSKPILVLTSGSNRVDERLISDYTGEPIDRADAVFVRATTGFAIGGVPPIGHIKKMETYLDVDIMQYTTIWAAGGTPNAVFELTPEALQMMTGAKVVEVKEMVIQYQGSDQ